jgi:hypothetical protein
VGQADSAAPEADVWVVAVNGEPWWETVVDGITLRDRSGIRLQEARTKMAQPQEGPSGSHLGSQFLRL